MRLREFMTSGVVTINSGESAAAARALMRRHHIRHLVAVDDGRVSGIVSDRDFGRPAADPARSRTVADVMTTDVVMATPSTTVRQAANLMRGHSIGSLLVAQGDELIGLVTTTDILEQLGRRTARPSGRPEPVRVARPGSRVRIGTGPAVRTAPGARGKPRRVKHPRIPAALPPTLPRAVKVTRGRSSDVPPPAHIRVIGAQVAKRDRETIASTLGRKLGKFASSIERVTVRLTDVNGPKGGRDQVAQIKVVISGLPSIVVEERDAVFEQAVNRAMRTAAVAVRRSLQRRRLKPMRRRSAATAAQT